MTVIATKRTHVYPITVKLVVWDCSDCGIVYGVPVDFVNTLRANGGRYYCPNGHSLGWSETDADRERKAREAAERRALAFEKQADHEREARRVADLSNRALRGHLTRIRNRIANGVCPVPGCRRSGFTKVRAHIASKHPDWLAEHVHDLG